jgi:tRNA pseudouridine55 synthase
MDGLLIVDKPSGPTSHDIVASVRRVLRERRVGHTGTLDPMASGVLPLVIGRATRLARFVTSDKTYVASILLGVSTDSYDAMGEPTGGVWAGPWPAGSEVESALERFRGTFDQQPPAFSAKKVAGQRSYAIARRGGDSSQTTGETEVGASLPKPARVTAYSIDLLEVVENRLALRLRCSAGFYVRSLAHDLGVVLGTGAHLTGLRRVEAAGAGLDRAISLSELQGEGGKDKAEQALIPMDQMLDTLPSVELNAQGLSQVRFGRDLGEPDTSSGFAEAVQAASGPAREHARLLDPSGHLVAIAEAAAPGLLHPSVVLM